MCITHVQIYTLTSKYIVQVYTMCITHVQVNTLFRYTSYRYSIPGIDNVYYTCTDIDYTGIHRTGIYARYTKL